MSLTLIIPNYNGKIFLQDFFKSLEYQKGTFEVIVIDNASTDGSVDYIKKYYPHFLLIKNYENLGFSRAVNQGIRASKTDYVFLLNNDMQLSPECVNNLINCLESDENIFAASCKMVQSDDNTKIDDAGDEYTLLGWTKRVGYDKPVELYNEKREIFSACAGAAIYRKKVLAEIGLFDENFYAYMEDVDISYRARINGYKCIYCPQAVVYHVGSGTSGSRYNEFKIKLAARNNVYVPYKNMPWPQLALNFIFLVIGFFIKYIFFLRKGEGKTYLSGLREGIYSLNRIQRVRYTNQNFGNYLKIEWLLIKNTFKFLFF